MIPSGQLIHRVQWQHKVITTDPITTAKVVSYTTYATRWCKIETLSARELTVAHTISSLATGKITQRYLAGMKNEDRALYLDPKSKTTRYFVINGQPITPLERREDIVLYVSETL